MSIVVRENTYFDMRIPPIVAYLDNKFILLRYAPESHISRTHALTVSSIVISSKLKTLTFYGDGKDITPAMRQRRLQSFSELLRSFRRKIRTFFLGKPAAKEKKNLHLERRLYVLRI